jgi:hypothetical protein
MDALSDVLRVAHLTGGVFLHAEFSAPWCIATRVAPEHCAPVLGPASHLLPYHYVVEGELHIRVDGENVESVTIGAGEVVLLPRNDLHLMGRLRAATSSSRPRMAGYSRSIMRRRRTHADDLRVSRLRRRRRQSGDLDPAAPA